jgi:hypothetical protein
MSEKRPLILPKVCSCTSKNQLSIPWAWALQVGSILLLKCANNYVHKNWKIWIRLFKHFSLYEIKYGVKLQTTETSLFQSNRVIHYFLKML